VWENRSLALHESKVQVRERLGALPGRRVMDNVKGVLVSRLDLLHLLSYYRILHDCGPVGGNAHAIRESRHDTHRPKTFLCVIHNRQWKRSTGCISICCFLLREEGDLLVLFFGQQLVRHSKGGTG
jgi:hypothetical protein